MKQPTLKHWLIASVVLNLFLAGGIAGGAWRWWNAQSAVSASAAQPRGLRYAAEELTLEQRRAYRSGMRDARRDAAQLMRSARDGRQEVLRLINAPQFDSAAATAALARTREADMAIRARVEGSVVDFAATLSPQDRQKFASGLARRSTLSPPLPSASAPAAKP